MTPKQKNNFKNINRHQTLFFFVFLLCCIWWRKSVLHSNSFHWQRPQKVSPWLPSQRLNQWLRLCGVSPDTLQNRLYMKPELRIKIYCPQCIKLISHTIICSPPTPLFCISPCLNKMMKNPQRISPWWIMGHGAKTLTSKRRQWAEGCRSLLHYE